jgi:hypothetical protein
MLNFKHKKAGSSEFPALHLRELVPVLKCNRVSDCRFLMPNSYRIQEYLLQMIVLNFG